MPITYTPKEGDIVLVDTEQIHLAATNTGYEAQGNWLVTMILHNRTAAYISFEVPDIFINGFQCPDDWRQPSYADSIIAEQLIFERGQLDLIDSDKVLFLSGTWVIKDSNRSEISRYPFALFPEGEDAALSAIYTHIMGENVFTREDIENLPMEYGTLGWTSISYMLRNELCVLYVERKIWSASALWILIPTRPSLMPSLPISIISLISRSSCRICQRRQAQLPHDKKGHRI